MTTVKEMLVEHNDIVRPTMPHLVLKTWTGNKKIFQRRIDEAKQAVKIHASLDRGESKPAPAKAKPAAEKKTAPKKAKVNGTKVNGTPVAGLSVVDIATSLKIDPKVARARLRRKGLNAKDGRWSRVKPDSADHKKLLNALGA